LAVCDASIEYAAIARVWKIMNEYNDKLIIDHVAFKLWSLNGVIAGEA